MITGEDLTGSERRLKVVFAVVNLATLGGALAATKLSELGGKESLKFLGKTVLIDFASNTAACGVGALGEAFDWPVPVTIMLSLAAGITISISGNKMLFKNADGIVLGETVLDGDEIKIVNRNIEDGSNSTVNTSGMDWYNYFRDTYGKENVCWESCNPSEVASAWQGTYPYVGVDDYSNITLHDGDIIWMGEPYPTGYSTTSEVVQRIGNDAKDVFGGLQVKPYYEKGMLYAEYRGNLTPYRVNGNVNVAEGVALKNPQFGKGGLAQRFDPNFDYNVANGLLTKIDSKNIELTNTKISLEEYFNMMNEIR